MPWRIKALVLLTVAVLPAAIWCQADEINARDVFYSAADLLDKPVIVCRAVGTCVTPAGKQRRK